MTETNSISNTQDSYEGGSIGLVTPKTVRFEQAFTFACGRDLPFLDIVYETYGELNVDASNAVLICHALSGDHHAAGLHNREDKKAGWWDLYIGPGKPIDTDKFFVVAMNNPGGCAGSTGPTSIDSKTGEPWGRNFPSVRVRDWVNTQYLLMQHLSIEKWAAVIGGSLGGMQAMRWSLEYPDKLDHCIVIASAMKLTAQNIGFNDTARSAIQRDPDFHDGDYYRHGVVPKTGLTLARMIGHITYLSDDGMRKKFGRELREGTFDQGIDSELLFQVESYLRYQGESFSETFDANTYLLMLRALDYFDLAREYDQDPAKAFSHAQCQYLVVSFSTDWRFTPQRSKEIVDALIKAKKDVTYLDIDSNLGHDAFLLDVPRYKQAFGQYMSRIAASIFKAA